MNKFLRVLFFCMPLCTSGQSAIGTSTPDASAKFEVYSTTQGFLAPRVPLTGTGDVTTIKNTAGTSVTPATGLMVYNTATAGNGSTAVTPGYYSYSGSSWVRMSANPSEVVDGTLETQFQTFRMSFDGTYGYSPLASISLPPGKWEITGEFICAVKELGFEQGLSGGVNTINGWYSGENCIAMNTYWISEDNQNSGTSPVYPIILSSLTTGAPTSDKSFYGSNVAILNISKTQALQQMKFYLTNSGTSAKTYYLHWHESYVGWTFPNGPDNTSAYAPRTTGSDRFFAVKIQ